MTTSLGSLDKNFCLQKLDSAIALIKRLCDGDHPQRDSAEALQQILAVYQRERQRIVDIDPLARQDTILEYCRGVNILLVRFKTFLGLLLRSTNLRNAFEIYFPIRILASELVSAGAHVVLGSEWNFSPYTYPLALRELPEFIFIGIPASECENPLILPLAGHELGHVVWRRKGAKEEFDPAIRRTILDLYRSNWTEFSRLFNYGAPPKDIAEDLILRTIWGKSYNLAQRHIEEIFCDFLGVRIFGASYLHSFRYLLAPSLGYERSAQYPTIANRSKFIATFATKLGIQNLNEFHKGFVEAEPKLTSGDAFILRMADEATEMLQSQLIPLVTKYSGSVQEFTEFADDEVSIKQCLISLVPPTESKSVVPIVNAAWSLRLELDKWDILRDIEDQEERHTKKLRVLRDLVLKSFEVYEYSKRLERNAPKRS